MERLLIFGGGCLKALARCCAENFLGSRVRHLEEIHNISHKDIIISNEHTMFKSVMRNSWLPLTYESFQTAQAMFRFLGVTQD